MSFLNALMGFFAPAPVVRKETPKEPAIEEVIAETDLDPTISQDLRVVDTQIAAALKRRRESDRRLTSLYRKASEVCESDQLHEALKQSREK